MKKCVLGLIVFIVATVVTQAQTVGAQAPDFTYATLSHGNFTLSQQQGKVVFVFVIGYGCSTCKFEAAGIKTNIVDVFEDSSNFIALYVDTWNGTPTQVTSFMNETSLNGIFCLNANSFSTLYSTTYSRIMVIDHNQVLVHKTGNGTGINTTEAAEEISSALDEISRITSVNKPHEKRVMGIYPNPANDNITIETNYDGIVSLSLLDQTGKLIRVQKIKNNANLNLSGYPSGTYFIKIESNNQVFWEKLIKVITFLARIKSLHGTIAKEP